MAATKNDSENITAFDFTDATDTSDQIINFCDCDSTFPKIEQTKPIFRIIGDMVYFKDIEKAIPIRKIPKDVKVKLGIKQ